MRSEDGSATDAQRERDHPDQPDDLQHAVGEHDLLGRAATALVDDERVPQHRDDERHDREPEPRVVAGAGAAFSNAQRQYAVIITPDATART